MIELRKTSFAYGPRAVLKGVSLSIADASYVGIVGPNGSGKSTLARLMAGILSPNDGEVDVDGIDTRDTTLFPALRQKIGLVFQNPDNQIVGTIVEDDVAFGPENLGLATEEICSRVSDSLTQVGLLALRERSPTTLSGGQKQRLAVASVLAMHPRHLVVDEPVSMLDPTGRAEVLALLCNLHRQNGVCVIHIAHHLDELDAAQRIVAIDGGSIIFDGTRAAFLSADALQRRLSMPLPPGESLLRELVRRRWVAPGTTPDVGALADALGDYA